jgi:hypothetical protein
MAIPKTRTPSCKPYRIKESGDVEFFFINIGKGGTTLSGQ